MAVGLDPRPDPDALGRLRSGLNAHVSFADLLANEGLALDPDALIPFARWCPRLAHVRIFDTRFYLARLPDGAPDPVVDATENVRAFWRGATDMLDDVVAGAARAIFPTRRNLERLAGFASFGDAVANARAFPVRTVAPWPETRDRDPPPRITDPLRHPVTPHPLASHIRG